MSYAATLHSRTSTAFEPSHVAHGASAMARAPDALLTGSVLRLLAATRPTAINIGAAFRAGPSATPVVQKSISRVAASTTPLSTTDMTQGLKDAGLPVSALADMMGVERKTVYAWLDGTDARNAKLARLESIHNLLSQEQLGALKWFHRYWERSLEGGVTLRGVLTADEIDPVQVRAALATLRPAVVRALESEFRRSGKGADDGPPGLLNLHLTAAASR